jgi:superfamily II DNA or RNA helicase
MNFTPRPYQTPAAEYLSKRKRGCVIARAGSGKTLIASMALDIVLQAKQRTRKVKVGWVANTSEQIQQAHAALEIFPAIAQHAEVTAACAAGQRDWSEMDVLIVDEAHHFGSAPSWQSQIATCNGALWFFTATPPEPDAEAYDTFCATIGTPDQWHTITREEVGQNLAHARVTMLDASDDLRGIIDADIEATMRWRRRYHRGSEQELWGQVAWQSIIKHGIVGNRARNIEAIELARANPNRQILMLVNQVEHAQRIVEEIPTAIACFSKMGKKKRAEALEAFRQGTCRCLVATSLADEGLDLPNADMLILVSGGRSKRLAEQRTGRVLRAFAGKTHGEIYDWHDTFHPLAAKQSKARQEVYRTLGYQFTDELPQQK